MPTTPQVLIIPGLYNSGPGHWQTEWQAARPEFQRVEQRDWDTPNLEDWLHSLDHAVRRNHDNVVLVGHSLGCILIAHWAARHNRKIAGALLVAPSDTEAPTFPAGTTGFAPVPLIRLPFPSIVIASTNDHYITPDRIRSLADSWDSRLISIGPHGHISVPDGFGPWPEGLTYVDQLTTPS
jgi:uncharacterized protein